MTHPTTRKTHIAFKQEGFLGYKDYCNHVRSLTQKTGDRQYVSTGSGLEPVEIKEGCTINDITCAHCRKKYFMTSKPVLYNDVKDKTDNNGVLIAPETTKQKTLKDKQYASISYAALMHDGNTSYRIRFSPECTKKIEENNIEILSAEIHPQSKTLIFFPGNHWKIVGRKSYCEIYSKQILSRIHGYTCYEESMRHPVVWEDDTMLVDIGTTL